MVKQFIIFLLCISLSGIVKSQSITVDDLVTLSSYSPKNFDNYMSKKGFLPGGRSMQDNVMSVTFYEKRNLKAKDTGSVIRTVDLYKKEDNWCFVLHTSSVNEYMDGRSRLKKAGFSCGESKDSSALAQLLFQKGNMTVETSSAMEDESRVYTFLLQKKELPSASNIRFGEDLLRFDSHEYLVSFFGTKNVTQDKYYFSETEVKKCSVLFANTSSQAVFVWDDEENLSKLAYVIISNILPTVSAAQYNGNTAQNKWMLRNGIYSGMTLRELFELNGNDFEFYGRNSEFSFMIAPDSKGNIDFKKIGLMLSCADCNGDPLLEKTKVSAAEAIDKSLPLRVFYIMLTR